MGPPPLPKSFICPKNPMAIQSKLYCAVRMESTFFYLFLTFWAQNAKIPAAVKAAGTDSFFARRVSEELLAVQNQSGAALSVHSIADGQAEAIEFRVELDTLHCNEPLKKIRLRRNILIAGISRRGRVEIPNGESSYLPGDSLVIVTSGDTVIHQLNDIFI